MKRLLFVEPNETSQKIFSKVLKPEENNWSLTFASSAEGALALSRNDPFDIVVSVNRLPGESSGLDLFDQLKEVSPGSIRFLLIEESERNLFRSLVGAAQQVLIKPLDLPSFTRQVNRAFSLRSVVNDPAILKLLGNADSLPPLPRVFQSITRKLSDPNSSLSEVAEIISQDIVLSSKVLKLVNSALFSLNTPASNMSHAVSLLGSRAVSSLVFSQSLTEAFKGSAVTEQFSEELNRHCIECAIQASNILSTWNAGRDLIEKAVFCGIAHDLGKLVLARYAEDNWKQIQIEIAQGNRTDVEIERAIIGISHCEIAAYLLAIWGFPNDQVVAIAFHHEPSKINDRDFGLLCALHLAENLCSTRLHGQHLDWNYLEACRITPDDVEALRTMHIN